VVQNADWPLISIKASSDNGIECGRSRQLVQPGLDAVNAGAVRVEKLRVIHSETVNGVRRFDRNGGVFRLERRD
jgi:hypothetical protein